MFDPDKYDRLIPKFREPSVEEIQLTIIKAGGTPGKIHKSPKGDIIEILDGELVVDHVSLGTQKVIPLGR